MPEKYNVYSFCGCGSGKKLKFCCIDIVEDILKVGRLQEQGHHDRALQALDRIEKKRPGYLWTKIVKGSILLETDQPEEAYHLVDELLEKHSDHRLAIALRADAALSAWGFDIAKPAIYQTFYMGTENYPHILSGIARSVAAELYDGKRYLAARQYLGLAMRLSLEGEEQQRAYMALMAFDGDHKIPYPFRSVHKLDSYEGTAENAKVVARADKFTAIGQWQAASLEYGKLIELDPENSSVWKNLGFCKAWDGSEEEAAHALHKAAELTQDFDDAVELETIAQLLDLYPSGEETRFMEIEYGIKNTQQLMSALNFHPRFQRDGNNPDAIEYTILGSLPQEVIDDPEIPLDELPCGLGGLVIYNEDNAALETEGVVVVTATEGEQIQLCRDFFEEVAGEDITPSIKEMTPGFLVKKHVLKLTTQQSVPSEVSIATQAILRQRLIKDKLEVEWATSPHFALDGKTPQEVSEDSRYRVKLAATVYLLDSTCEIAIGMLPSVAEVLKRFNLPEPAATKIDEHQPLHLLSNMQIHRLELSDITDEQLRRVLDRMRLTNHSSFVYLLLTEALSRPEFAENHLDMNQVCSTFVSICQKQNKTEEALKWVERGRESVDEGEGHFEAVLQWDARKLSVLVYQQDDAEFRSYLQLMREQYGHKIPQYLAVLEQSLTELLKGPLPVSLTEGLELAEVASSSTEIWTPESESEQQPKEEKKLWLPGS